MSLITKNLSKNYQQADVTIEVLKKINLEVQSGETLAIVGQSGSGKSTLLSLLAGLDKPTSGSIEINGVITSNLSESAMTQFRAQNIGIVFQQFHLLTHLTALENVMLPLEILKQTDISNRALQALEALGLDHRKNHFPSQMSGGECQRVAIARAIVVRPQILLADEPSGNLDIATGSKVMDHFFEIIKSYKITTLLVTHNQELADQCDRKVVLTQGVL